jgi:hypothetical protein
MTDLETLVEKWSKEAGLLLTAPCLPELWKNFARLAMQYAAEEAAKVASQFSITKQPIYPGIQFDSMSEEAQRICHMTCQEVALDIRELFRDIK